MISHFKRFVKKKLREFHLGEFVIYSKILLDKVKKEVLKQAVDKSLDSHSSFKVKLKSGLFWDYFEYNDKDFIVKRASRRGFNRFNYFKNNYK